MSDSEPTEETATPQKKATTTKQRPTKRAKTPLKSATLGGGGGGDEFWGGITYAINSYLPRFIANIADPQTALMHHFDVQRMFADAVYVQADGADKKRSLKRFMGKAGSDHAGATLVEAATAKMIGQEAERVCSHVQCQQENFVSLVTKLSGVKSIERIEALYDFAPYLMIDYSVASHPRLRQLNLSDIKLYIKVGQNELHSYIYCLTAAQGYGCSNAEKRCTHVGQYAAAFVAERASSKQLEALPIGWRLHPSTNTPLSEREVHEQKQRIMAELPLMIIGVFRFLRMECEKQALIDDLIKSFI